MKPITSVTAPENTPDTVATTEFISPFQPPPSHSRTRVSSCCQSAPNSPRLASALGRYCAISGYFISSP